MIEFSLLLFTNEHCEQYVPRMHGPPYASSTMSSLVPRPSTHVKTVWHFEYHIDAAILLKRTLRVILQSH